VGKLRKELRNRSNHAYYDVYVQTLLSLLFTLFIFSEMVFSLGGIYLMDL
jgi:hypothetical protein